MQGRTLGLSSSDGQPASLLLAMLPEETLSYIFSFVELKELQHCLLVCKGFHRIADDQHAWRERCVIEMGEDSSELKHQDHGDTNWKEFYQTLQHQTTFSKDMSGSWFPDCGGYWKRVASDESEAGEILDLQSSLWWFSVRARMDLPPGTYQAVWRMCWGSSTGALKFSTWAYHGLEETGDYLTVERRVEANNYEAEQWVDVDGGEFIVERTPGATKSRVLFGISHAEETTYRGHKVDYVKAVRVVNGKKLQIRTVEQKQAVIKEKEKEKPKKGKKHRHRAFWKRNNK